MATTKKPSGLAIARSVNNYTASWNIADADYGNGQELAFKRKIDGVWDNVWLSVNIGKTTKSKTFFKLNPSLYFPTTTHELNAVKVRVRGNRKAYTKTEKYKENGKTKTKNVTVNPGWSDWAEASFDIKKPVAAKASAALDSNNSAKTTFSWASGTANTNQVFTRVVWQAMRVKNSNETDGSKLTWKSNSNDWRTGTSSSASSSTEITEDTAVIWANYADSYTRWFRCRAEGLEGSTAWSYAKHVYAMPWQAKNVSASVRDQGTAGYLVTVTWDPNRTNAHPVDSASIEYAIATPASGITVPTGTSWSEGTTSYDTSGTAKAIFNISSPLSADECLWVRVSNKHDSLTKDGYAKLALKGALTAPTLGTITPSAGSVEVNVSYSTTVPDRFTEVYYKTSAAPNKFVKIGTIASGQTSGTFSYPASASNITFGARAVVNSTANGSMYSDYTWQSSSLPGKPTSVTAKGTDKEGTVEVAWAWNWTEATAAEISWADHDDAWMSTDEPSNYTVTTLNAPKWHVSGLEEGKVWYFRVRLLKETEDSTTYSPWSDIIPCDLSSAPSVPLLRLSPGIIAPGGSTVASWTFVSGDGTNQAAAQICKATITGSGTSSSISYGAVIASTDTAQHITLDSNDPRLSLVAGNTYNLCLRVMSASQHWTAWSDPVAVTVAEAPNVSVTTNLVSETITSTDDEGNTTSRTVDSLKAMPLTVTVTGAGAAGTSTVIVERAENFESLRPDENINTGYDGETVAIDSHTGEDAFRISKADHNVIGQFDDGAKYRIIAIVTDSLGQKVETSVDFEIHWTHQAIMPDATCVIDGYIAKITPNAPEGTDTSGDDRDLCDIYRLSVDKPELIVQDGEWGTTYVDPYPTIGPFGGHRIVFKTANGDYIIDDNSGGNDYAWVNKSEIGKNFLDIEETIIDFDGDRIILPYNLEVSNAWSKDFQETQYLGGAIQGDWNPAVSRTGSVGTVVLEGLDPSTIASLRRLAVYPGICHVRTPEGSSFAADIQVSEDRSASGNGRISNIKLTITRVDPEGFDGVTLAQWEDEESEEEVEE